MIIRSELDRYYGPLEEDEVSQAISALRTVIGSDCSEGEVQAFLGQNAWMVIAAAPVYDHQFVISQAKLGAELTTDFAMYGSGNATWWTLVELERPGDRLFTKNGDPSARLVHAMRQVRDWRQWIQDNSDYSCRTFGNHMGLKRSHIVTGIILGRRSELSRPDQERLLQMNREDHYNWIITYDAVLDRARSLTDIAVGTSVHKVAIQYGDFAKMQGNIGMTGMTEDWFARRFGGEDD